MPGLGGKMQRTDCQREQSRLNGAKSTSLLNPANRAQGAAAKSGIFSPLPCLTILGESREKRLKLLSSYLTQHPCASFYQLEQVKTMFLCHVKRDRINRYEAEVTRLKSRECLAAGVDPNLLAGQVFLAAENTFNKLSLMEARFTRQYNKAYKLWLEGRTQVMDIPVVLPTAEEIFAELMHENQNVQIQPETAGNQVAGIHRPIEITRSVAESSGSLAAPAMVAPTFSGSIEHQTGRG